MNRNLKFDHLKITFRNMSSSAPMEAHAISKLDKILDFLRSTPNNSPLYVEMWLDEHRTHPHQKADLHLKTPIFDLFTSDRSTDMYLAIDNSIDKMVQLLIAEKDKMKTVEHHPHTPKTDFYNDNYTYETEEDKVIRDLIQAEEEGDFEENLAEIEESEEE